MSVTLTQAVVPLVLAAIAWAPFAWEIRRGRRRVAAAVALAWGLSLAVVLGALESARPGTCGSLFPGAARYADAMLAWARTGAGCESDPGCFVPQHLLHAAAFCAAALATGGALALVMAAVLFGWMGAYTGGLAAAAANPALAAAVGWHPWAIVRVVAYVALGVGLSEPLLRRGLPPLPGRWRWILAGAVGLALDLLLKLASARVWWQLVIHPLFH